MAKQLDTSITDTAARRFLAEARQRQALYCDKVTGLRLLKVTRGGSWRYRYQDATGKRREATIGQYPNMKPQQAAEKAIEWRNSGADVLAQKARGKAEATRAAALAKHRTLRAYLEGPYTRHQSRKKSGAETLNMIRHNFADWLDRDMETLNRSDVLEWQQRREAEGRAHSTLQRAYGALKTLLRHAGRQDPPIIESNPLDQVSLERPTDTEQADQASTRKAASRRLLTGDEIDALHTGLDAFAEELRAQRRSSRAHGKPHLQDLDALAYPHWFIPFAYTALYTGFRPGDLFSLTWEEANVTFGRLVKTPEKTRHHPEPAQIVMDMPEDLQHVLREWWEQNHKPQIGLVFPSPVTGDRMDKKAHLKPWRRVKRHGGLPDNLDFYSLRHHFISALVAAGVSLFTVARLAGHKSTSMIERNYGHLCPTAAGDAMEAFAATVSRGMTTTASEKKS